MKSYLITCILFLISTISFAQNNIIDTVHFNCHIVNNGFLLTSKVPGKKACSCDEQPGIMIYSDSSAVYSAANGGVEKVFSVDRASTIVMIRNDAMYYVYNGLAKTQLKQGDSVNMNQFVGDMAKNSSSGYQLNFQVWKQRHRKRGEPVAEAEMMQILQTSKSMH